MGARFSDIPGALAFIALVIVLGALLMVMAGFGNPEDMRNVVLYSGGVAIVAAIAAAAISFNRRG